MASSRSTIVGLYGAVLTADIVRQASVGASLKATLDRFIGTLGGARLERPPPRCLRCAARG